MHGLVVVDTSDRILRPAILWNDQRTGVESAEIERLVGMERLIELTGNRALPGFTAPKLAWLRKHEPRVFTRVARVMLPKDYVRLRLCDEHATDVSDASGTLLLDVSERRWSSEVVEALGVDPAWLPVVLESPEISGHTPFGVPVAAGGGDQAAGALGVGVDRPGPVSVVLGTSGVVFAALERFVADRRARVHAFCHAVPGAWHAMGVMLSAAGSLRWLRETTGPETSYDQLVAEAAAWPAGTEGLLFLPYLAGERTPHAAPDARGAFYRAEHQTRPWGAREGSARGGGVRAARLARPARRAGR
jgi:xylulokinase